MSSIDIIKTLSSDISAALAAAANPSAGNPYLTQTIQITAGASNEGIKFTQAESTNPYVAWRFVPADASSDFTLNFFSDVFNTTRDNMMLQGINLKNGGVPNDPTKPSFGMVFEGDYNNGSVHWFEWYLTSFNVDGLTRVRPLGVNVERGNVANTVVQYNSASVKFASTTEVQYLAIDDVGSGNCTVSLLNASRIEALNNKVSWRFKDVAGTDWIDAWWLDTGNRINFGATTKTNGDVQFDTSVHGPILIDTANGHTYRLTSTNGALVMTQVT